MNAVDLLKINVNDHTEKKGNLTYLSWAWAWQEAIKADPQAEWTVKMFGRIVRQTVRFNRRHQDGIRRRYDVRQDAYLPASRP
jgi:hypothetical protein